LRDGEPYAAVARRRREAIAATRGRGALAVDDLAQVLTFATRAAGHALLGGDWRRPRDQLAALVATWGQPHREPPGARIGGAPRRG
jgi:hypothetical protein